MKYDKSSLRNLFILKRKKKYVNSKKFNFQPIFRLINKHFNRKKIIIAGYYPSNYELDILRFLKEASKKKFKVALPVIKKSNSMSFKPWVFEEPLYVSKYGILEPGKSKKDILPDFVLVPLVAFDNNLNRIGYGGGFYDRYLKKIKKNKKVITIGLAYSFQKVKKIPTNKYDIKLDFIVTNKKIK